MVPAQAGLSLLKHLKYVRLSQERHDLVVVSWREKERADVAMLRQDLAGLDDVKGEGDPTWSVLLGDVSVVLAAYGGDQSVPRASHQGRSPTPGHVRGLRRERQRGGQSSGEPEPKPTI